MAEDAPRSTDAASDHADHAAQTRAQFSAMLLGALIPTAITAVLAVILAAVLGGPQAAGSAAFGAALVIASFSLSLLVMRSTAHQQPTTVMAVVLAAYTGKIVVLALVLILLYDASWLNGQAMALSIIACTLVWLALEMRAFTRLRILVAPGAGAP